LEKAQKRRQPALADGPHVDYFQIDDLVSLFRLDEGEGTSLADAVEGRPLGMLKGDASNQWQSATLMDGSSRPVLYFNGACHVEAPAAGLPGQAQPRTIMGWFSPAVANPTNGPFGYGRSDCNNAYYTWIENSELRLDQWCQDEGVPPAIACLEAGKWYHVAFSYDRDQNHAYLNGEHIATGTPDAAPSTQVDSTSHIVIGGSPGMAEEAYSSTQAQYFQGWVADFAVYSRALSPAEVQSLFAAHSMEGPLGTSCSASSDAADATSSALIFLPFALALLLLADCI